MVLVRVTVGVDRIDVEDRAVPVGDQRVDARRRLGIALADARDRPRVAPVRVLAAFGRPLTHGFAHDVRVKTT
jgi:hypothetical protein